MDDTGGKLTGANVASAAAALRGNKERCQVGALPTGMNLAADATLRRADTRECAYVVDAAVLCA